MLGIGFLKGNFKKSLCLLVCGLFTSSAFAFGTALRQDTQATSSDSSSKSTKKKRSKKTATATADTSSAAAPAQASAPPAAAANTPAQVKNSPAGNSRTPAAGSGMVWVNLDTHVYHKQGDRWYGKTKNGKYMSEADAVQAGFRPAQSGKQTK